MMRTELKIYKIHNTRFAFSLVEVMIVVALLGILAAIAFPRLQGHITEAKEAAAKDNLRIFRNAIELYAVQHNGVPPGYTATRSVSAHVFHVEMVNGGYIPKIPTNPFNGLHSVQMISDGQGLPVAASGGYGWIYKPQTKQIRLNWPGTDGNGVRYYDY